MVFLQKTFTQREYISNRICNVVIISARPLCFSYVSLSLQFGHFVKQFCQGFTNTCLYLSCKIMLFISQRQSHLSHRHSHSTFRFSMSNVFGQKCLSWSNCFIYFKQMWNLTLNSDWTWGGAGPQVALREDSGGLQPSLCSFIDGRPLLLPVCALLFWAKLCYANSLIVSALLCYATPTVSSTPPSYVPTVTLPTFTIPRAHIMCAPPSLILPVTLQMVLQLRFAETHTQHFNC